MTTVLPGQRVISESEPELGLGELSVVDARQLTVLFPAAATTRQYARGNAPLTRLRFGPGDTIRDRDGQRWTVTAVRDEAGLLHYQTNSGQWLPETALSPRLSLGEPLKRLLAGQTDAPTWFALRRQALAVQGFIEESPLLGLCSGRTELLPHQLYIAHEVATRPAPRVLLSDEVGLGKTIEACLILQQQLFSGLASRILVLVPEPLLHQWLVELLRRFNLHFTLLDQARCLALTETDNGNPFDSEQLILSSLALLREPRWHAAAFEAGWDLLIVDEAHHLLPTTTDTLSTDQATTADYDIVGSLAAAVPGLLLLTATPDQGGLASHFGLLQLLDPQRFHDYTAFAAEQQHYAALATLLDPLAAATTLDEQAFDALCTTLAPYARDPDLQARLAELRATQGTEPRHRAAEALLAALLDRHGTGRVAFRNTRRTVSGFPARQLYAQPLPLPACYQPYASHLRPEQACGDDASWLRDDPRIVWLCDLLATRRADKFLLICHSADTATALEQHLRLQRGLRCALFHEGMALVERDRAAAWFAEREAGAQLLVCSEIGSEGRNFQFSQHLVLFDLPRNPDLLEQRIGRLDRIGQQHEVAIHVPYFRASAQEVLLHFHTQVLDIFTAPNPVAAAVASQLADELETALAQPNRFNIEAPLWHQAQALNATLLAQHAAGRDRLLELNSCRPQQAAALRERVLQVECGDSPAHFLDTVFAAYGLDCEVNGNGTWTVAPADDMLLDSFPQIPDEGLTFTFERELALARDDLPFVNWLHPLLLQSLDLMLQEDTGKCSAALLHEPRLPSGTLVLESLFRVTVSAPAKLQARRWFPTATLRAVIDTRKRSIGKSLPSARIDANSQTLPRHTLAPLLSAKRELIQQLARLGQGVAEKQLPALIAARRARMEQALDAELSRLRALQAVNPQVQDSEITYLEHQRDTLGQVLAAARLQLDALRLLVVA